MRTFSELVEQGLDQRQRAQIDDFLRACSTMPRECHGSSCGSKLRDEQACRWESRARTWRSPTPNLPINRMRRTSRGPGNPLAEQLGSPAAAAGETLKLAKPEWRPSA